MPESADFTRNISGGVHLSERYSIHGGGKWLRRRLSGHPPALRGGPAGPGRVRMETTAVNIAPGGAAAAGAAADCAWVRGIEGDSGCEDRERLQANQHRAKQLTHTRTQAHL